MNKSIDNDKRIVDLSSLEPSSGVCAVLCVLCEGV